MQKAKISKSSKILLFLIGISVIVSIGIIIINAFNDNSNQQIEIYNDNSVSDSGSPFN